MDRVQIGQSGQPGRQIGRVQFDESGCTITFLRTVAAGVQVAVRVAIEYGVPSISPSLEALCDLRIVCGGSAVFGIIMP